MLEQMEKELITFERHCTIHIQSYLISMRLKLGVGTFQMDSEATRTNTMTSIVGGVLYQPDDADGTITADNIVAICSSKLSQTQQNYPAYKKELWGIVYCFRQFVWGRTDLVLWTDHK